MNHPISPLADADFRARLDACIRCGLCLPACPTYAVARTEMEGPRGRVALMRAAAEGRIGVGGAFREHLDSCLGCRSCETACPSGVRYGSLLEDAREAIERERPRSTLERLTRWLALRQLLPHRRRLRALATLTRMARALGLLRLAATGPAPAWTRRLTALLPDAPGDRVDDRRPVPAVGESRGTVMLLRGCVQDAFLPGVNAATTRVLARNGYEVRFAAGETCCGAAALHLGETKLARQLARRNVDTFARESVDAVVSNAGGCGAMLGQYSELLAEVGGKTTAFAAKVRDASELLSEDLRPPEVAIEARAVYVDSCHLRHARKVTAAPRELLRQIPGLELVELERPDFCCGSAGVYNLTRPEEADRILELKMAEVRASAAEIVVVSNPGCQLQLAAGVRRAGLDVEVMHLMELLDRAYGGPP